MRIHGSAKITRHTNIDDRRYEQYENELREDFHHMCGYCGKSEAVTKKGFEIDHFVPQRLDKTLRDVYSNLVYSCFTCNRKKGKKWPTEDPGLHNDGQIGFVDPGCDDYDNHLGRDDQGKIIAYTPLGEYMSEQVFKFGERPTDTIWKAMKILELKQKLRKRIQTMSSSEMQEYIAIDQELENLMSYIFKKKE